MSPGWRRLRGRGEAWPEPRTEALAARGPEARSRSLLLPLLLGGLRRLVRYPDVQNHTLDTEYASKIILGEWPIDGFEEFVKKWNESGGAEVTRKAREAYAKIGK